MLSIEPVAGGHVEGAVVWARIKRLSIKNAASQIDCDSLVIGAPQLISEDDRALPHTKIRKLGLPGERKGKSTALPISLRAFAPPI
jgi:hypothetical protein